MNGRVVRLIPAVAMIVVFGVGTVFAEPNWVREKTIDLTPWFGGDTNVQVAGTNPWSVETDGTKAFVGGFNNSAENRSIGVLVLDDIRGAATGTVPSSLVTNIDAQGSFFVTWDPVRGSLYSGFDSGGSTGHCYFVKTDDMGNIDTNFGPDQITCSSEPSGNGYSRPPTVEGANDIGRFSGGIAVDPGYPGDPDTNIFPGVSYAFRGNGRRQMVDGLAGTVTYHGSLEESYGCIGTENERGFVYTFIGPPWYTLYRSHAFDPDTGDVYLRTHNRVYKAVRTAKNGSTAPTAPLVGPDQGFPDSVDAILISGTFVELIPASSGVTGSPIVAFNSRPDFTNNVGVVYLRSAADGSTTGLTQTELYGSENGGDAYSADVGIFSMAYGKDPSTDDPILLVCSEEDRRLDVFVWKEAAAPEIAFTDIRRAATGAIEVEWDSADGVFDVERATDVGVGDWTPVGTVTNQNTFTDGTPPDPQGFYRAGPAN